ncbi:MAG TPA: class I SAM-dependent methyltransferase [Thermomicrobiales bacterium]|nr:class I SAM-dependent methyltransferase [Thermomicrobiales bacterium]
MPHDFDKDYWKQHWRERTDAAPGSMATNPPHPYLARETATLTPGMALDAGCGAGAEAIWLASAGWRVTAVDISTEALTLAAARAAAAKVSDRISLVEADLSTWAPDARFDLVMSHYAHPAMPQLDFYARIATWVKPGGTLLLVGHLHTPGGTGDDHHPPTEASVTAEGITARLGTTAWRIETADECDRTLTGPGGREVSLHDVVVRATRLG